MQTAVTVVYYVMTLYFLAAMAANFIKTRDLQKSILYLLVMTPFVMRLCRLK